MDVAARAAAVAGVEVEPGDEAEIEAVRAEIRPRQAVIEEELPVERVALGGNRRKGWIRDQSFRERAVKKLA